MEQSENGWKKAWQEADRLLDAASAFILNDFHLVESLADRIHLRISAGARVAAISNINSLDSSNRFLSRYGIQGTSYRVLSSQADAADQRGVRISRDPACFLDSELFKYVDAFQTTQLWALAVTASAIPVLLAPEGTWAVDSKNDYPMEWYRKTLPVIARWSATGGVFVSGSLIPGIQENEQFVANALRYLVSKSESDPTPAQLCERAEKNLADFMIAVLKSKLGTNNWWSEGVPQPIRMQCGSKREEEKQKFPLESYLTLLDMKSTVAKHWILFSQFVEPVVGLSGKERSLKWIEDFNEVRKLVAHPLKAHLAGYQMSPSEVEVALRADSFALRLLGSLSPVS